jgi:hypothetical protein
VIPPTGMRRGRPLISSGTRAVSVTGICFGFAQSACSGWKRERRTVALFAVVFNLRRNR